MQKFNFMKLGTHNSMSYLPPKKWYMYPFRFIAKCQSKDIKDQYKLGARMFDIRVSFNNDDEPILKHGIIEFKTKGYTIYNILGYLNMISTNKDRIYVRTILEDTKEVKRNEELFKEFCHGIEEVYTNLIFFDGNRKFDWKTIHKFTHKSPMIKQAISSMDDIKINDIWPWLYAKLHNKESLKKCKESSYKGWLLLDFIEIQ